MVIGGHGDHGSTMGSLGAAARLVAEEYKEDGGIVITLLQVMAERNAMVMNVRPENATLKDAAEMFGRKESVIIIRNSVEDRRKNPKFGRIAGKRAKFAPVLGASSVIFVKIHNFYVS